MSAKKALWCLTGLLLALACDPVHDDAVTALGTEIDGMGPGPEHRPGQPCNVCHGSSGPGKPEWSVAGTVFQVKGQTTPLNGATVNLVDASGRTFVATTNRAGNFYVDKGQWEPVYPMHVSIAFAGKVVEMKTHVARDASCAGCHVDPASPTSPGGVYFAQSAASFAAGGL